MSETITPTMYVFEICDGDTHLVVASSPMRAIHLLVDECIGGDPRTYVREHKPVVTKISDSEVIEVNAQNKYGKESVTSKTARQWADAGVAVLGTTY